MKKILLSAGGLIAMGAAYLAFWPVPIDPVAWDAPVNSGYTGDFAPNTDLANLERLDIGGAHGPEDVVALRGKLYVSSQSGAILEIDPATKAFRTFAQTGGSALGMEADAAGNLIIADAFRGLVSVSPSGEMTLLTDSVDGTPILYADDLDIAQDGVIYFSDASTKFGAESIGSTLAASLMEIMEARGTGRLLAYDPRDQSTRVVANGFVFSNGVAMHPDGDVLMLETGKYRLLKINPQTGVQSVVHDNLPGFPDNINRGPDGTFLFGLISQRSEWLDKNSGKPSSRKLAMRLPAALRPKAVNYGLIVQMDADGNILRTLQDPSGSYPGATGAVVAGEYLYVSSLLAHDLGRKPYTPIN